LVDLDVTLYEGVAIEDNLDAIFSIFIPSNIPKWWAFKLLRWAQRNP
jgi:hypothetical protein